MPRNDQTPAKKGREMTTKITWDATVACAAGALDLATAVCGVFGVGYITAQFVADDGATSAANVLAIQGRPLFDSVVKAFELIITGFY